MTGLVLSAGLCDDPGVAIDGVVFDIGGVLEVTPATGWGRGWADELGLPCEEFERRLGALWRPGSSATSRLRRSKVGLPEHSRSTANSLRA